MTRIKICGLCRPEDIEYANEALPDYAGFVFAESRRQVTPEMAAILRARLSPAIIPVGVFVNAPAEEIAALYRNGVIRIAQLHGEEDEGYIEEMKARAGTTGGRGTIEVIKTIRGAKIEGILKNGVAENDPCPGADYLLFDSGAGGGLRFDWGLLKNASPAKPWFLAGGINAGNVSEALALRPFGVDVSSGAETGGVKDREKMLRLTRAARGGQQ